MSRDLEQSNSSLAKVSQIQKELSKLNSENSDQNQIMEYLNTIKDIPMSVHTLESTRIGLTVNNLRRASHDKAIKSLARTIILKWRQLLPSAVAVEDGSESFSTSTNNNSSSGGGGVKRAVNNDSVSVVESCNKQRKIDYVHVGRRIQDEGKQTNTSTGTTTTAADNDFQHPLLNHIVLSTMAKYLPPQDLVSLRLTCKPWNEAIIPELRKRNPLIHLYQKNLLGIESLTPNATPHHYVSTMSQSSSVAPFGRISIRCSNYKQTGFEELLTSSVGAFITYLELYIGSNALNINQFRSMIFKYLPVLRELSIQHCLHLSKPNFDFFWKQDRLFNEEFPSATTTLPNLTRLKLSNMYLQDKSQITQDFLTDLFNAAINLEALEVDDFSGSHDEDINYQYHLTTLTALRAKSTGLDKLKQLNLRNLKRPELQFLNELSCRISNRLQLKEFKTQIVEFNHRMENNVNVKVLFSEIIKQLQQFLVLQASSLVSLSLSIERYEVVVILALPIFKNLKSLSISTSDHDRLACFRISSFATCFPVLEKFSYDVIDIDPKYGKRTVFIQQPQKSASTRKPIPTLKELKVCLNSPTEIQQLLRLFPMISKLDFTVVAPHLLTMVFKAWPQLEILHVKVFEKWDLPTYVQSRHAEYVSGVDQILTGIPQIYHDFLNEITEGKNYNELNLEWLEDKLSYLKTNPGISDLKKLREFSLRFCGAFAGPEAGDYNGPIRRYVSIITDVSCYYGLALLKDTLRSLYIPHNVDDRFVSRKCKQFMSVTFGPDAHIEIELEKE